MAALRLHILAARPDVDPDEVNALLGASDDEPSEDVSAEEAASNRLPSREAGLAWLKEVVTEQLDDLRVLSDELWSDQDEPDRDEAEERVGVDTSPEGGRLHKYEKDNELSLHRNLNQLIRVRKIEPEHQTIARWNKTGQDKPRRWVGTGWEPYGPQGGEEGASEEEMRPEYAQAPVNEDYANEGSDPSTWPVVEASEPPESIEESEATSEAAETIEEPIGRTPIAEPVARSVRHAKARCQNEANGQGSSHDDISTLGEPESGSEPAFSEAPDARSSEGDAHAFLPGIECAASWPT